MNSPAELPETSVSLGGEPGSAVTARPDAPRPGEPSQRIKTFVLDTNVLLHNPSCLFLFDDNQVVIPFTVLEELDKFKKQNDDVGRNARQAIRHLDSLRGRGALSEGVVWNPVGGSVRVDFLDGQLPPLLRDDHADNRIIGVAWKLRQQGVRAIVISKDINVRLKSDAMGIPAEDFEAHKVDADRLFQGYVAVDVPGELIDQMYDEKQLELEELLPYRAAAEEPTEEPFVPGGENGESPESAEGPAPPPRELVANEFVLLRDQLDESHTGLGRRLGETEHLIPVAAPRKPVFGIMARNMQQTMALDLLLDDEIKLVTLLGSAGTGKTLLALAAGMTKVFQEERFDKLLVARPIMPLGRDIGYLPGDKDAKLSAWMQPIFDNLTYLLSTRGAGAQYADSRTAESRIDQFMDAGRLVLEPLTYIRGRSIPNQFIVIDEAQNLTPHEVKTIVSRVGDGTKIVLTGDVQQIDNPYLDSSSNGLSFCVEQLKGYGIVGTITLMRSERSVLASLAAAKL